MKLIHKVCLGALSLFIGWGWLFTIADADGRTFIEGATAFVLLVGGVAIILVSVTIEYDKKQFEKTED